MIYSQVYKSRECNPGLLLVLVINVFKFNFELMAIQFQSYEWFALWFMMNFQRGYDITTVGVEKRKFKPKEKVHWILFKCYLGAQLFLTSVIVIVPALLKFSGFDVD